MKSVERVSPIPNTEPLWGPAQTADYLGIPVATLYKWRVTGDGPPGYRVGRHLRYDGVEVRAWVRDHADERH